MYGNIEVLEMIVYARTYICKCNSNDNKETIEIRTLLSIKMPTEYNLVPYKLQAKIYVIPFMLCSKSKALLYV